MIPKKYHQKIIIGLLILIIIICCWSQFEGFLDTGKKMVLYYSHNCPHSVAMERTWDYFAKYHQSTNIRLVKHNLDEQPADIYVLPSVRAYAGGRIVGELQGNKSYDNLEAFYYHVFELR